MMTDNMDLKLSAWLDNELDDAEARALEEQLESDAALRARLDAMQANDASLRKLYEAVDKQPMPQAVLDLLESAGAAGSENVVELRPKATQRAPLMPMALAASVGLLAGFLGVFLLNGAPQGGMDAVALHAGLVSPESPLHDVLEGSAAGEVVPLGDEVNAEVLFTFEDVEGGWCRQIRVDGSRSAGHAVACRSDSGWQIEAFGLASGVAVGEYQAASTAVPNSVSAAVDSLIGSGSTLSVDEEISLISEGWKEAK